jgi:uncharacterized protein YjiS (DUF1127 family)
MRSTTIVTATSHVGFHGTPSITGRAAALLRHVAERSVRLVRGRQELRSLASLSDHELRDIGLSRHDLDTASLLPLTVDPTAVLASMVRERDRLRRWSR